MRITIQFSEIFQIFDLANQNGTTTPADYPMTVCPLPVDLVKMKKKKPKHSLYFKLFLVCCLVCTQLSVFTTVSEVFFSFFLKRKHILWVWCACFKYIQKNPQTRFPCLILFAGYLRSFANTVILTSTEIVIPVIPLVICHGHAPCPDSIVWFTRCPVRVI